MALPTDTFTPADLAVMIPEIWGSRINDFYRSNLKAAAFFTDRSAEVMGGGDTLYTPGLTEMSANTKTNGAAVTLNSPTETTKTLTVSTWSEVSFMIEDKEAAQVKKSYSIQEAYAKNAGFTAAKELDSALTNLFDGFSNSVGTTTVALTDAVVREAISLLDGADANVEEAAFFFAPKTIWEDLMGIDKFSLIQNTNGADPVMKGAVGMLYGIPVISTTNIKTINTNADYAGVLATPDAIHFATASLGGGNNVRVQSNYMPEYLATLTTADICYGVVENRDEAGVGIVSAV